MNGPQHYAAAQGLLARSDEVDQVDAALLVAQAQVHATLAAAAATALGLSDGGGAGMRGADAEAWERSCSVLPVEIAAPLLDELVCGAELNPGAADGVTCIRYTSGDQHADGFHDDGRGNRW